jgi:hypothetical protein
MTSTVTEYYTNGLLSEIAYADFAKADTEEYGGNDDGVYSESEIRVALTHNELGCKMSISEANDFISKYDVVSYFDDENFLIIT